jgi:RNA polymerase sigma factor (sigma-70 family)
MEPRLGSGDKPHRCDHVTFMTEPIEPTDSQLWDRALGGEPEAFGELFDRHSGSIFAFCLRRTGDRTAAEDLMSATFLHAWRRRADVDLTQGPLPWLYGIAANLVRRHLRGASRREAAMAAVPPDPPVPDPSDRIADRLDEAGRVARVMSALRSLPESDRELFVLCVWQELSYEEAAAALGIPVGTVRSRLSRARSRLRLMVEPAPAGGDGRDATDALSTGRKAASDG